MAVRLTEEERERRREQALKMFRDGVQKKDISSMLKIDHYELNQVLEEHGLYRANVRPTEYDIFKKRYGESIGGAEINNIRQNVKIGDVLFVRTEKSDKENGDDINLANKTKTGSIRKGVVVSKTPRLCIVKLKSGVREAFMWRDVVMAQRANRRCIG